jgi:hypothetical protein
MRVPKAASVLGYGKGECMQGITGSLCVSDIITENMVRKSMCTDAMEVRLHAFLSLALDGRTGGQFHDPVDVPRE